jgi:hypothetical protein
MSSLPARVVRQPDIQKSVRKIKYIVSDIGSDIEHDILCDIGYDIMYDIGCD